jgi:hypothetical protein
MRIGTPHEIRSVYTVDAKVGTWEAKIIIIFKISVCN